MYSHLGMNGKFHYQETQTARYCHVTAVQLLCHTGVSLPGSEREGHEDALNSGARCGQAKLHSPVIHEVELHISKNVIQMIFNI